MTGEESPPITDADVRSLAAKLKGLHALLTPGEQALLQAALRQAAGREQAAAPDTDGFVWAVSFNPFTYLDAIEADAGGPAKRAAAEPSVRIEQSGQERPHQKGERHDRDDRGAAARHGGGGRTGGDEAQGVL
jgi:hypothetical protein